MKNHGAAELQLLRAKVEAVERNQESFRTEMGNIAQGVQRLGEEQTRFQENVVQENPQGGCDNAQDRQGPTMAYGSYSSELLPSQAAVSSINGAPPRADCSSATGLRTENRNHLLETPILLPPPVVSSVVSSEPIIPILDSGVEGKPCQVISESLATHPKIKSDNAAISPPLQEPHFAVSDDSLRKSPSPTPLKNQPPVMNQLGKPPRPRSAQPKVAVPLPFSFKSGESAPSGADPSLVRGIGTIGAGSEAISETVMMNFTKMSNP